MVYKMMLTIFVACLVSTTIAIPVEDQHTSETQPQLVAAEVPAEKEVAIAERRQDAPAVLVDPIPEGSEPQPPAEEKSDDLDSANTFWGGYYYRPYYGGWGGYGGGWRRGWGGYGGYGYGRGYGGWGGYGWGGGWGGGWGRKHYWG